MQEPKIKPIFFSIVGGVIISILFLMITFWIFYTYSNSPTSAKDALSTTASFFGGVATLWAACIAAYLFTNWKDQHNKNIQNNLILDVITNFRHVDTYCSKIKLDFENFRYSQRKRTINSIFSRSDKLALVSIINDIKSLRLQLAKLSDSYHKMKFLNNPDHFTRSGDSVKFDQRLDDLIKIINNFYDETLTVDKSCHLIFNKFLPKVQNTIHELESTYILNLYQQLKAQN